MLDVGCGTGVFLRLASRRGARTAGLDGSEALLRLARERVPEADLRVGDLQSLPFADGSFDLVTGFNSFFFAADMVAALREARRVARHGGTVLIQVWGRPERCALTAMKEAVFPLGPPPAPDPGPPLCKPGVLEGLARAAGLEPRNAFDLSYAFHYPDRAALVRRLLAPAPVVAAVERAGEDRVREALVGSLARYRRPHGGYELENEWHFLLATA